MIGRPYSRLASVGAMVFLALSVGMIAFAGSYKLASLAAMAALVAVFGMVFQLNNPFLGLSLFVVTATLVPFQFSLGAGRAPMNGATLVAAGVCSVWLLGALVLGRWPVPQPCRAVVAAIALTACAMVSLVAGQRQLFVASGAPLGAQVAQLGIFLISVGLFLAMAELVGNVQRLEALTWVFLSAGTLACLTQIVPAGKMPQHLQTVLGLVHMETAGSLFWTWLVTMAFSQALFNRDLPPAVRLALTGIPALVLFRGLVMARSWTSGWLPPLVALAVLVALRIPRFAAISGIVVALIGLYSLSSVSSLTPEQEQYSAMTRLAAADSLWPLVKASPVLGLGPANYYYYSETSPILGWYVRFSSHNQYIDLAAQLGVLGLLAFMWFAYEVGVAAWRLRGRYFGDFRAAYVAGAIAGLTGSLAAGTLADWILPFYYNIGLGGLRSSLFFWLFLGGLLVLTKASNEEDERQYAFSQIDNVAAVKMNALEGESGRRERAKAGR